MMDNAVSMIHFCTHPQGIVLLSEYILRYPAAGYETT